MFLTQKAAIAMKTRIQQATREAMGFGSEAKRSCMSVFSAGAAVL